MVDGGISLFTVTNLFGLLISIALKSFLWRLRVQCFLLRLYIFKPPQNHVTLKPGLTYD